MNKIYKVVWNAARNCYVVGSEFISKTRRGEGYRSNVRQGSTRKLAVVLTVLALTTGMSSTFVQAANEVDSPLVKGKVAEDATGSFAIGEGSKVTSSYENSANAASVDSLAIGTNAEARNRKTVAVGSGAIARGDKSTAIGVGANTAKDSSESLAVGYVAKASGNNAVALGNRSIASEDNTVSVGVSKEDATNNSPAMTRRIVNVSDGIKDSDAATYGQVKDVQDDIDALDALAVQYDGVSKSTVTFDGTNGTALKNVSDIVMNTKDFYDKNAQFSFQDAGLLPGDVQSLGNKWNMAIGEGSAVKVEEGTGSKMQMNTVVGNKARITQALVDGECQDVEKSTALGQGVTVAASNAVGVGQGSNVRGEGGVAVGMQANVSAKSGVAVGKQSKVSSDYSIAIGSAASVGSKSENSVAMGYNAGSLAAGGTAIGQGAKVQGSAANGTAIGKGAIVNVNAGNSVALGASSQVQTADIGSDTEYGVVSVGKSGTNGFMRRIVNVADGTIAEDSHDAVTGGQLYTTNQNVADNADKLAAYEKSGIVPGSIVDGSGTGKGNMALGNMSEIEAGDGMDYNTAIGYNAGISQEYVIGKGYENAENSTAIGASARIYGSDSVAVGHQSSVTHKQGVAIGQGAKVESANSVAVGHEAIIKGNAENSIAIGNSKTYDPETGLGGGATQSVASGAKNSTVIGVGGATTSEGAVVLGYEARVNGSAANATAIGKDATIQVSSGNGNVALGAESEVSKADVGDDTAHGVVSIGKSGDDGFTRRIINVADGINATDAATVGQISTITGMDSNKGNVVQYDGEDKSVVTFAGENGTKLQNVGDIQIGNAQSTFAGSGLINGKVYKEAGTWAENGANATHSMAVGSKSSVRGKDSIAVGPEATVNNGNSVVLEQSTAVGSKATVLSNFSTALGANTQAKGDYSVAIGAQSQTTEATNATAIGAYAAAGENSVVVGGGKELAASIVSKANGTAMGTYVDVNAENGTALGYGSQIGWNGKNSVALGADSVANEENVVSVGHTKGQANGFGGTYGEDLNRRITNVADGKNANDAATVGQISKITGMDSEKGNVVQYDGEDKSVVTFAGENGTKLTNVADGEFKAGSKDAVTAGQLYAAGIVPGSTFDHNGSMAIGLSSNVIGDSGTAIGVNAGAGENAVAIGNGAGAMHLNATAVGENSKAMEEGATALGKRAWAEVANSTAIGYHADVELKGDNSVALGANSIVATEDILDTDTAGVVSVGSSGHAFNSTEFNRRIINVADGVNDNDAATVGQIKTMTGVDAKLGGVVQYDDASKNSVTFQSTDKAGTTLNNVNDITMNVEKYLSGTSIVQGYKTVSFKDAGIIPGTFNGTANKDTIVLGRDSTASKDHSVVIGGGARAIASNTVSIGTGASADANNSMAIGSGSKVIGAAAVNGTAIGTGSQVTDKDGTALGYHAYAWGEAATVVGSDSRSWADGGTTLGQNARIQSGADNSVALGKNSYVSKDDILAGDTNGVVSVGVSAAATDDKGTGVSATTINRRIINVADGINDSDAATVGQIKTITGIDSAKGNVVQYDTERQDQITFGGANGTALLNISNLSAKTATIGNISFTNDGRITNVTAGVDDSDVATVGQIKNLTGLDSAQGNVVQYDKDGNLNVGVGDSSLQVNDTAASISHGDNSVSVGADGTTVTGDLNVTGDLTFNGETVSSDDLANAANVAGDVSDIKEQIGAGADGKLGLTNEQTTLVGGINANTEAINGVKTIVGDGELDNGAADLTAGINANSAAIEQNRNAIGALGSRVSDLGEEVDSVGAISAALAGLHPLDYNGTGSKFQISAALGTYDGTQAAAIGGFYHFNRDTLLSIGGSTSFEGDRKTAANVGVTFRVGEGASEAPAVQDTETKQQMEAMKQEIEMLKAELEQLKNKDTEGTNDKN